VTEGQLSLMCVDRVRLNERFTKVSESADFPLILMQKDFHLILNEACEVSAPLPMTAVAQQIAEAARNESEEDASAIIQSELRTQKCIKSPWYADYSAFMRSAYQKWVLCAKMRLEF